LCVCSAGRYTVLVSVEDRSQQQPLSNVASMDPAAVTAAAQAEMSKPRRPNVNIFDLRNKIICGTTKKVQLQANEKVFYALHDSGVVFLITSLWRLIRFKERDTSRKLNVLLTQGTTPLYPLAITLAAEEQMEPAEIMKLYKQYADYLHSKGDFDASIVQYAHTIGYIPPSYVVMKFLDPYRVVNLIYYLEKLLDKGLHTTDLVTLLLACYTKVKDEAKLKQLLDSLYAKQRHLAATASSAAAPNSNLDAPQAISILCASGFTDLALRLAVQHGQHGAYLEILLQQQSGNMNMAGTTFSGSGDASKGGTGPLPSNSTVDEALGYLAYMPFVAPIEALIVTLRQHSKVLLRAKPKSFTALLIRLCTGDYGSLIPPGMQSQYSVSSSNKVVTSPDTKSTVATTTSSTGIHFAGDLKRALPSLFSEYVTPGVIPKTPPVPATELVSLYAEDSTYLLAFLEGVAENNKGRSIPAKLATMMLELYLDNFNKISARIELLKQGTASTASSAPTTGAIGATSPAKIRVAATELRDAETALSACEASIMGILDGANAQYDIAHALLLTASYEYERGNLFLLDKQRAVALHALRLTESQDSNELFKLLRREGNQDPELFIQVLTHFVEESSSASQAARASFASPKRSELNKGLSAAAVDDEEDGLDGLRDSDGGSSDKEDDNRWDAVMDVMDMIEKDNVLSPVQVLTILAGNPDLPLHVASNFIRKTLKDTTEDISQAEADVKVSLSNLETISRMSSAGGVLGAGAAVMSAVDRGLSGHKTSSGRAAGMMRKQDSSSLRGNPFGADDEDEEEDDEDGKVPFLASMGCNCVVFHLFCIFSMFITYRRDDWFTVYIYC
jgi:hypothetical protein